MSIYPNHSQSFPAEVGNLHKDLGNLLDSNKNIPEVYDALRQFLMPLQEVSKILNDSITKQVKEEEEKTSFTIDATALKTLVSLGTSLVKALETTANARDEEMLRGTEQQDILEETIQVLQQRNDELTLEVGNLTTRNQGLQSRMENHKREALRLGAALSQAEVSLAQKQEPEKQLLRLQHELRQKDLENESIRMMYSPDKPSLVNARRFSSGTRLNFSPRSPKASRSRRASSGDDLPTTDEGSDNSANGTKLDCECKAKVRRLHDELKSLRRSTRGIQEDSEVLRIRLETAIQSRDEAENKLAMAVEELDELRAIAKSNREYQGVEGMVRLQSPSISEPYETMDGWEHMLKVSEQNRETVIQNAETRSPKEVQQQQQATDGNYNTSSPSVAQLREKFERTSDTKKNIPPAFAYTTAIKPNQNQTQCTIETQTERIETCDASVQTKPLPKLTKPMPSSPREPKRFAKVMVATATQTEHTIRIIKARSEDVLMTTPTKETSSQRKGNYQTHNTDIHISDTTPTTPSNTDQDGLPNPPPIADCNSSEATISSGEEYSSEYNTSRGGTESYNEEELDNFSSNMDPNVSNKLQLLTEFPHEHDDVHASPASSLSPVSRGEFGELIAPGSRMQFVIRGRMLLKQTWSKARRVWKHRFFEMEGPTISVFRNCNEKKAILKIPLDGVEVRVVKGEIDSNKSQDKKHPKKQHKNQVVSHEFFIWHPVRPVYQISAPSEPELYRWVEAIQTQCTSVSVRPRRAGASFLTFNRTRYFAVLRENGIHFYAKPTDNAPRDVVLVDTKCQIRNVASNATKFLIWHRERGEHIIEADSAQDCTWWIDSLSAHALGVVSWGALFGIKDDGFGVKSF